MISAENLILKNRSLNRLQWAEFSFVENGVKIVEKDFRGIQETLVDFDKIGKDPSYFLYHSPIAKLGVIVFTLLSIFTGMVAINEKNDGNIWNVLFWLVIAVLTYAYYQNTKREGFRLASDFGFVVLSGKKPEVLKFIDELLKRKEEYIFQNAKRRLEIMERSEVERYLLALREGSVITVSQYETLRIKTGLHIETKPRIGFL